MRLAALVAATSLMLSACGGGSASSTATFDATDARAVDFAVSARRALQDTRFSEKGDRWLADLIVQVCATLDDSEDPDATVLAVVAGVEAPPGEPVDDEILTVVVAEGVAAVCPDALREAAERSFAGADPHEQFLAVVDAGTGEIEPSLEDEVLLGAGTAVCGVLDGGGSPESAVLAEIEVLFGIVGSDVSELSDGMVLDVDQSVLAGAVLAAALAILCPHHGEAMVAYLEGLPS